MHHHARPPAVPSLAGSAVAGRGGLDGTLSQCPARCARGAGGEARTVANGPRRRSAAAAHPPTPPLLSSHAAGGRGGLWIEAQRAVRRHCGPRGSRRRAQTAVRPPAAPSLVGGAVAGRGGALGRGPASRWCTARTEPLGSWRRRRSLRGPAAAPRRRCAPACGPVVGLRDRGEGGRGGGAFDRARGGVRPARDRG